MADAAIASRTRHSIKSLNGWSISRRLMIRASAARCSIRSTRCCCWCLLAVLAGAESWVEIAEVRRAEARVPAPVPAVRGRHAVARSARRHLSRPSMPKQFQSCFIAWVALADEARPRHRRHRRQDAAALLSGGRREGADPHDLGVVQRARAWCSARSRSPTNRTRSRRSRELLDLLTIKGATVTIDAMGCQREIAAKIIEKEADYVLALKGNQGTLREDVELFFTEQKAREFKDTSISRHETLEKSHGRIETRTSPRSTTSIGSRSVTTGPA